MYPDTPTKSWRYIVSRKIVGLHTQPPAVTVKITVSVGLFKPSFIVTNGTVYDIIPAGIITGFGGVM